MQSKTADRPFGRRRWRRPRVSPVATGWLAALIQARSGDGEAISEWQRTRMPAVVRSLSSRMGFSHCSSGVILEALGDAWQFLDRGGQVEDELAWLSDAIGRILWREARAGWTHVCLDDLPDPVARPGISALEEADERERLRARIDSAAGCLPQPYCRIIRLRGLHGLSVAQVTRHMQSWRDVSKDACVDCNRRAIEMVRFTLAGGDPRARWPQRYLAKKNPWIGPPRQSRAYWIEGCQKAALRWRTTTTGAEVGMCVLWLGGMRTRDPETQRGGTSL